MNHLPFLRAIAQAPHDDLPRLVYADALEESGVPEQVARAHFIRGQIELEGLPTGTVEERKLRRTVNQLFAAHHQDWIAELPPILRMRTVGYYKRGFVEMIFARRGDIAKHGKAAFEFSPITRVQLLSATDDSPNATFDEFPYLSRVESLSFPEFGGHYFSERDPRIRFLDRVFESRVWTNLIEIDLSGNPMDDPWLLRFLHRLPQTVFADRLLRFSLNNCTQLSDIGLMALANSTPLKRLERLCLKGIDLNPASRRLLKHRFGNRVEFESSSP